MQPGGNSFEPNKNECKSYETKAQILQRLWQLAPQPEGKGLEAFQCSTDALDQLVSEHICETPAKRFSTSAAVRSNLALPPTLTLTTLLSTTETRSPN